MTSARSHLIDQLTKAGIRPSVQRLAVLEYVASSTTHPTADEIYMHLKEQRPMLSRATVFNTLRLLAEKHLINDIDIAAESTRYDSADYQPHAHFLCRQCGRIFDVPFDISALHAPDAFKCDNVNLYFKGICPQCKANNNNSKNIDK